MPDKKLTEELLNELLDAPSIDGYIKEQDFAALLRSPVKGDDHPQLDLQLFFRFRHVPGILHPFFHVPETLSVYLPSFEGSQLYGKRFIR